ncbi:MAG: metal ABC transporter permease [Rhodobacteraceae bacterium]|nr:metal ABC transporter permease [Paracoccaceae bacterium]
MEDFFLRALIGGMGITLATGPIGCFVVWLRVAYFGTALAHTVLLGVALGYLLRIEPVVAVLITCFLFAGCLALLERRAPVSLDTLLGVLAHLSLAGGLVALAFMENVRVDLIGYLFGDILSIGIVDLWLIAGTVAITLAAISWQWQNLLAITIDSDLAAAEGIPVERVRLLLIFLLAAVIAIGMKMVGMLLVVALVIIPAAAARRFSSTPETMGMVAIAIGAVSVGLGLMSSLTWNLPAGPAIVLVASLFFLAGLSAPVRRVFRS